MKKSRKIVIMLVALMMISLVAVSLAACNSPLDPETRPLTMSISKPDGVFNPFFSSSAYDSTIVGMTQIGMLNTDTKGDIVCGENEPTVVKDYTVKETTSLNADGTSKVDYTTYEFLIKNGIKWSDGEDLTIKDVLFNLYVYLDPVYTGSSTIYSTDIVGLKQYRTQKDNLTEAGAAAFDATFISQAQERIQNMIDYVGYYGPTLKEDQKVEPPQGNAAKKQMLTDYAVTAITFYNELKTDWNSFSDDKESYKEWGVTETWQLFMLNDGGATEFLRRNNDNTLYKEDGHNVLDMDEVNSFFESSIIIDCLEPLGLATYDDSGEEFVYTVSDDALAVENAIRDYCIDSVFSSYFSEFPTEIRSLNADTFAFSAGSAGDAEMNSVHASVQRTDYTQFYLVAVGWGTASTILENFTAEQKSIYFQGLNSSTTGRRYKTVEGITTYPTTTFNGQTLDGTYDVLSIKVNGVDPKAIYNFAFTVAPMHYYSTTNYNGKNYIGSFNAAEGEFGLAYGDTKFMNEVIKDNDKIGVPVGAGAYKASSYTGGAVTASTFFYNQSTVCYERNTYFETVGKELSNAKIKYVRYSVVDSEQVVNALLTKTIDLGDPSATAENKDELDGAGLKTIQTSTNGYGYVGINPWFVPNVTVRRIIMKAMDRDLILSNYYKLGTAEIINRPISRNSWAFPTVDGTKNGRQVDVYTAKNGMKYDYAGTTLKTWIADTLEAEGYELVNGVWQAEIPGFGLDKLDYKFTIAGGSTDHPAYAMFLNAQTILNDCGFDVKVVPSPTALSDLSSGKLAVWAAAWSSTIDPDMYQTYHMESQASSVRNWGYPQILGGATSAAWADEYQIVVQLSGLIDKGRATTDQAARKLIYAQALDTIMELAVELPTYQRNDLTAYQNKLLDPSTLPTEYTAYSGLLARMWEINYL